MVHLIFDQSSAFLQQLNQNIATDCSSILHIEYRFCKSKIDLNTYALKNQWCAQNVLNIYIQ